MVDYDWSSFNARIDVKADLDDVYTAWTTRTGLERWFLRVAEFTMLDGAVRPAESRFQRGDRYRWLWHGYDDTVVESGVIRGVNDRDLLRFTFAGSCLVTVRLTAEEGLTIVDVRQDNIPLDEKCRTLYHVGRFTGWTLSLANLKSILEGGIDLRNKNARLRKLVNSLTAPRCIGTSGWRPYTRRTCGTVV